MNERLDALSVRESNGKSYFTKIGVAFPNKDGKGFSLLLDAIPAPTEGQFKVLLRVPEPKDRLKDRGTGGGGREQQEPLDDDVPFATSDFTFEHPVRRVI